VDATKIIAALRATGIDARPKEQRLDLLYLRGCDNLTREVLSGVDSLVRHERDPHSPYASQSGALHVESS
jgi:hypothetical protein